MTKAKYIALDDLQSLWTDTLKPFISQNYAPLSGLSSVVRDTTSGSKTIASAAVNTVYSYATISGLTVTALAAPTNTAVPAEYVFEFTLGSTVGTMSFPASVVWVDSVPEWQANKHYRVEVLYNAGDGNYYARCYGDGSVPSNVALLEDASQTAFSPNFDPETDTVHVSSQSLTTAQKTQARTNIGAADASTAVNSSAIRNIVTISHADYTALASKNNNTLYIIS